DAGFGPRAGAAASGAEASGAAAASDESVAAMEAWSSAVSCESLSPATAVSAAPEKKSAVKASVVAVRRFAERGGRWVSSSRDGAPPNSQLSLWGFRRGIAWLLLASSAVAATGADRRFTSAAAYGARGIGAPDRLVSPGMVNGGRNHQ